MEYDSQQDFERELDELPELAAMLEGWHELVGEHAIVYAAEVSQGARPG
jgi:hypothetical protein